VNDCCAVRALPEFVVFHTTTSEEDRMLVHVLPSLGPAARRQLVELIEARR